MVYLAEPFEHASSGANLTNATTQFDSAVTTTGPPVSTLTADNSQAAHGSQSAKLAQGTAAGSTYLAWIASMGSQSQAWFRAYFLLNGAQPGATLQLVNFLQGTTAAGRVGLNSSGHLILQDSAGTTQAGPSTSTVSTSAWWRIEGYIIGSAIAGQLQLKYFASMDATSATETLTTGAAINTTGNVDHARFGITTSSVTSFTMWMDDVALSSVAYIGAAGYPADSESRSGTDGGPGSGGVPLVGVDDAVGFP